MNISDAEEIDAYIAGQKTLIGYLPNWEMGTRRQWQVRWGISGPNAVENSELFLSVSRDWRHQTIICLHRQRMIYRLDIVPETECKPNLHSAWKLGLPLEVCGPHVHGWQENRQYVISSGSDNRLPHRRLIPGRCETLSDAMGWVGEDMNIHIAPDQRDFQMPNRALV